MAPDQMCLWSGHTQDPPFPLALSTPLLHTFSRPHLHELRRIVRLHQLLQHRAVAALQQVHVPLVKLLGAGQLLLALLQPLQGGLTGRSWTRTWSFKQLF
jgi:hypothetical protein